LIAGLANLKAEMPLLKKKEKKKKGRRIQQKACVVSPRSAGSAAAQ